MDIPNAAAPGSGPHDAVHVVAARDQHEHRDATTLCGSDLLPDFAPLRMSESGRPPGFERLAGKRQLVNQCSLTVYRLIGGDAIVGTNNTPVSGGPNET